MPTVHNLLTIFGYRSGHQSGLGESSGQKSTNCLHGFAFRDYVFLFRLGGRRLGRLGEPKCEIGGPGEHGGTKRLGCYHIVFKRPSENP